MTGDNRIERALPRILEDLGAGPDPDYTDFILARTVATSQRPGWISPEGWFFMSAISQRLTVATRFPMRAIAVVALLILVLAAAVLIVGSQQRRLPTPYGPASNGHIVYDRAGDIFVGDPATGETHQITNGPELDSYPNYSHDGTKISFVRSRGASIGIADDVMVVDADGTDLRRLTAEPIEGITQGEWSGDGRSILSVSAVDGRQTMTIFDVESGEARKIPAEPGYGWYGLPVSMPVSDVSFRPPDGAELLFVGETFKGHGIYIMRADGSNLRQIVGPTEDLQQPHWAPDGSRIAYSQFDGANGRVFMHIVGADGKGDVTLKNPPGVIYQVAYGAWGSIWSPDGKSVLVGRSYWDGPADVPAIVPAGTAGAHILAIVSVDGSVPDRELGVKGGDFSFGSSWGWSPDGTKVVYSRETEYGGMRVVDVATGEETILPGWYHAWWQRVAGE